MNISTRSGPTFPPNRSGLRRITSQRTSQHPSQTKTTQRTSITVNKNQKNLYNPIKQAREQDPNGDFIRRWIPELHDLSTEFIHRPYAVPSLLEIIHAPNRNGYPEEIVSFEQSARRSKELIYAVRKDREAKQESRRVFNRHGSRSTSRRKTFKK